MSEPKAAALRVLFVCGRAAWRSPTAARLFGRRAGIEARARGVASSAQSRLTAADLEWAELVVAMEREQARRVRDELRRIGIARPLHVLDIPDRYGFMDAELVALLEERAAPLLDPAGVAR